MAKEDLAPKIVIKAAKMTFRDLGYIGLYILPFIVDIVFIALIHDKLHYFKAAEAGKLNFTDVYSFLIWFGTFFLVSWIVGLISASGVITKVNEERRGNKISAIDALGEGLIFVPRLIGASILYAIIILAIAALPATLLIFGIYTKNPPLIGLSVIILLFALVPVIYVSLRLTLFAPACIIKDIGCLESLKESWKITKGNLLFIFVALIFLLILSIPFIILNYALPDIQIGSLLSILIMGPIYNIAITLIFLELTGESQSFSTSF